MDGKDAKKVAEIENIYGGRVVKGWCLTCFMRIYQTEYRVNVPDKIDVTKALTQEEIASPPHVAWHTETRYRYSLEPHGASILACPHCGTFL